MTALFCLILCCFSQVIGERQRGQFAVPKIKQVWELSDRLMKNYSKHILPFEGPWPFNIDINVHLVADGDIDEIDEKLSAVIGLEYKWRDESMRWNKTENNITYVTFGWLDVWKPVFRVTNPHADFSDKHDDRSQDTVTFDANGWAFFDEMVITRTTCDLDMSFYPFDIQTCTIKFSIVGDSKFHFKLNLSLADMISHSDSEHGSWSLIHISKSSLYGTFEVAMEFKRKPLFILLHILMPIIVLALLTPIVFVLPKKSGERVGFSVTMLLAISVYMTIVSDHLPQNSEPMPLLLIMMFIWYTMDAIIVFIVIINSKIYKFREERQLLDSMRKFVYITRVMVRKNAKHAIGNEQSAVQHNCIKNENNDSNEKVDKNEKVEVEQNVEFTSDVSDDVTWQELSHCIDKWCFVISYVIKITLPIAFLTVMKLKG